MFGRFKPARDQQDVKVVVDLDRMVLEQRGFRFNGKVYMVKPMKHKIWLGVCNELAALNLIANSGKPFDRAQVRKTYWKLISKAVDGLSSAAVEQMTDAQMGALVQLVIECVTGKAYVEKKTLAAAPA